MNGGLLHFHHMQLGNFRLFNGGFLKSKSCGLIAMMVMLTFEYIKSYLGVYVQLYVSL